MAKNIRIGIIGLGNISDIHAQAIAVSKNAELVSAYSRSKEKAENFGEKYGVTSYDNWGEFITDSNLDAVSICTPNGAHLEYSTKAAEAGKHVIIEKPIEVTVERAKELINSCERNNVKLAVIYQSRFMDKMGELKEMLDQGVLGKVFMGDAYVKWFRSQEYYDSGAWRGSIALDGGGVMINQAIHTIDLLQWLMGDVASVFGQTGTFSHELEGEDNAVGVLRYKSGALGVIQGSTSIQPSQSRRIEIHGEKGTVIIDGDDVEVLLEGAEKDSEDKGSGAGSASPFDGFSIEPHKRQFESIVEAILLNKTPTVSGEESLKSLAIVSALYESAKANRLINIDEFINS